jgi:hypothetical protein
MVFQAKLFHKNKNKNKNKTVSNPYYALKSGLAGLPKRVSFYGAAPIQLEAYEVKHAPSIEITDSRGRVTYSNYFYGEVLKTLEQADVVASKLNSHQRGNN